ncbi:MAG: amidohydrolase family protein [Deltaproteobacteria bacterium]|nr:amidohydrolase family protein [Deltaproteobacteria bacterium]
MTKHMLIKAPHIITLEGPPLKDHAILIRDGFIADIAPQSELKTDGLSLELPNTILLPGLINAHCHLELSQLPQPLPYPGSFVGWIDELTRLKLQMTPEQTEAAIKMGIQKLLEGGTTTVADHMSVGTPLELLMQSPLEAVAYIEVLGVERERANHFYKQALETAKKFKAIPTPHATYSLLPEIFAKVVAEASDTLPLSIHISESADEFLLFLENRGPLAEFLQMKGKTPPTQGETPVQYLKRLKLLPYGAMAIHANYLEDEDIATLNELEISVVHCPGSHAYFEHDRFPYGSLEDAEINVALGTDSLASNESLSMLRQMQIVSENYVELKPEMVLKMATLNGATALRKENEIGSLKVGKRANIIGVPVRASGKNVYENVLMNEKVSFSMIRGQTIPVV